MTSAAATSQSLTSLTSGASLSLSVGSMTTTNAAPMTNMPNLAQIVTVKLTRETYLLWKAQIVPILHGNHLYGYVDGTAVAPPKLVPAS